MVTDRENVPTPNACQPEGNTASPPPLVTADQECWVRDRILTAIRMALAVHEQQRVGADCGIETSALQGIADGCAAEVIHTLGLRLGFVNIRKRPDFL